MLAHVMRFLRARDGVTSIEYGLIAVLAGVAIIGGLNLLGSSVDNMFVVTSSQIDNSPGAQGMAALAGGGGATGTNDPVTDTTP